MENNLRASRLEFKNGREEVQHMQDILRYYKLPHTKAEIARRCHVKRQTIDYWVDNENSSLKEEYVRSFCNSMGMSMGAFYLEDLSEIDYMVTPKTELCEMINGYSDPSARGLLMILKGLSLIKEDIMKRAGDEFAVNEPDEMVDGD